MAAAAPISRSATPQRPQISTSQGRDACMASSGLLSPLLLSDREPSTSSSASYGLPFAPPRIDSFSIVRKTHQTRPKPAHAFDDLPWISAMDSPPEYDADPWDIADLSQLQPLPAQPPRPATTTRKAGGPIRTARSALRLRTSTAGKTETENISKTARRVCSTQLLRDTSSRVAPPRTVTPRHQNPVTASSRFRGLMPEFAFASLNNTESRRSVPQSPGHSVMACSTESSSSTPSSSLLKTRTHPSSCQRSRHDLLF